MNTIKQSSLIPTCVKLVKPHVDRHHLNANPDPDGNRHQIGYFCQLSIHNTEFNSALFYIIAQLTASELEAEVLSIKDLAHRQVMVRFFKV